MRSTADPEDTRRVIQSFLSKLADGAMQETPIFKTLEIENTIEVVSEPDGLVPHRYKLTKVVRGTVAAAGAEQRVEQIDSTETHYAYPEAAAPAGAGGGASR